MNTTLSKGRIVLALAIALASDAASIWAEVILPLQWAIDGVTALFLFLILGRRWQLLPALVAEAIPGVAAFPSWILVVMAIAYSNKRRPPAPGGRQGPGVDSRPKTS